MKNLEVAMKISIATLFSVYMKTHFIHFNVIGTNFYEYHKLTDKIWKDLIDSFDVLGEQIRILDILCPCSMSEFKKLSQVEELTEVGDAKGMLYELLLDTEKLVEVLNETEKLSINHVGLQNVLQGLIEKIEKWSWMLRSTIKNK